MAKAYITEYRGQPIDRNGLLLPAGEEPAIATQVITFTTTTASAAFNASTKFVRIHTDGICSFVFGAAPVATTSDPRMAASATEYFGVKGGHKVAFITNT